MEPLLTTEDVAGLLRVEIVTVRRLVGRGELPAYRVGGEYRFKAEELEAYLERQRVPGEAGPLQHLGKLGGLARKLPGSAAGSREAAFQPFTKRARKVLTLSQEEARRLNHSHIGTEHLLLGLIRERDGIAAGVLQNLGVDLDVTRQKVEQIIGTGDTSRNEARGEIGLTPRSKKVLQLAIDEARELSHDYIGTEHVLLGLLREGEGIAARVLTEAGITLDKARSEVVGVLAKAR
jgi:excisionase family DNA binding protein